MMCIPTPIVLTAFEGENNSSNIILNKVRADNVIKVTLPNKFDESAECLISCIKEYRPSYVISMGRKPQIKKLYIEPAAHDKLNVITTTFDLDMMCSSLTEYGISFCLAKKQSNYLCNHVYYRGLDFIHNSGVKTKMVFIHTPDMKNFEKIDKVVHLLSMFCNQLRMEGFFHDKYFT